MSLSNQSELNSHDMMLRINGQYDRLFAIGGILMLERVRFLSARPV